MAQHATDGCGLRLNNRRVTRLANQWLAEERIPLSPPLVVAIESPTAFAPLPDFPEAGFGMIRLQFPALIDVIDGIHRIAAIRQMDLSREVLAETEWPIELIECTGGDDATKLSLQVREHLRPRRTPKKQ